MSFARAMARRKRGLMAIGVVLAIGVAVVLLAVVGSNDRPGEPSVYARIAILTDCADLQTEFDVAALNTDRMQDAGDDAAAPIAYMEAANARMEDLGCFR